MNSFLFIDYILIFSGLNKYTFLASLLLFTFLSPFYMVIFKTKHKQYYLNHNFDISSAFEWKVIKPQS